ncbi:uncharacterized protein LOC107260930 [Ricinus communis]|uniref:uncharacterized protein LOC107260930 n=1 Tax=Ricinus communis TaxID=3988 RepID=UPI0007727A36|nr:uncharacterized protein LOC107260930 [Ricinus communis]|eukprot:XP_015572315.1 uncharacterized protein LOC107260930 [Ricinus communis]
MSEDKNFMQHAVPRFDGHYDHWSLLMENLLRSKGYWSLIETGYKEPAAEVVLSEAQQKEQEELMLKDLKTKNYLFQAIDRIILEQILEKRIIKQIWDSMKTKFKGNARVKRSTLQALRRDFEILEMKTSETITEYFARVMIVSIEESNDIDALTIDELQSSLIVHEQKFQKRNGEEQALKYECPAWEKEANYAELNDHEEILLMSCVKVNHALCEDIWFLDSGCSNHMSGNKAAFCELNETFWEKVKLENGTNMLILGKGRVRLNVNGSNHVITDVFYVPELKNNLLSIGQL